MTTETQFDLFDICRNRHRGNEQSEKANRRIAPHKANSRLKVLEFARSQGERGITTDEVSAAFSVPPNSISGRITELKKRGLLVETTRTRLTRAGSGATVLVAKEEVKQ